MRAPKPTKAGQLPASPHRDRFLGLLLIALSTLALISLLTYTPSSAHLNWLGLVGHSSAWVLRYLFGLCAYPLTLIVALVGKSRCRRPFSHVGNSWLFTSLLLLFCGLLMCIASDSSLAERFRSWTFSTYTDGTTRIYLGGVPLNFVYRDVPLVNLRYLFSPTGTGLVALCGICLCAAMLSSPRTWLKGLLLWAQSRASFPIYKSAAVKSTEGELPQKREDSLRFENLPPTLQLFTHKDQQNAQEIFEEAPAPKKRAAGQIPQLSASSALEVSGSEGIIMSLPTESLLTTAPTRAPQKIEEHVKQQAGILEETLLSFGIEAKVGRVHFGPTIVSFEVHPAIGVKVQRIKALENDLALNMQARSIRIIAPIPGKAAVGVEVPAKTPQEVSFKEMLSDYRATNQAMAIPLLLGKSVSGESVVGDLAKMPHLIIAGATGSGKSVCINTIVMSILMNARPEEIRLVMVDPKKVELTAYSELPHMIAPVITEAQGACEALNWLVKEMERRYEVLRRLGLRNITAFNTRSIDEVAERETELEIPLKFPYIVGIIDELADLMMSSSSDIETPITRIAQMARAVGIHLILATQRPSREVITGLIKANFPARIAFKVANRVNSQIILDEVGAESLLGNGDMLYLPPGTATSLRAQGAFIRDEDINQVVRHICAQAPPHYLIASFDKLASDLTWQERDQPSDPLFDQALRIVCESNMASTTYLQRKLKIGYARAASLVDLLEERGVISSQEGSKPRRILITSTAKRKEGDE